MTESEGLEESWKALGVRTDIPHPARVYDYMLGGKDNFAADREMAVRGLQLVPEMLDSSRGNRDFLVRAVAFLRDEGIRQFLDIGTGLPISPNTHEIAQQGHPDAARYLAALAPGSYLVLSHSTDEFAQERTHQASAEAARRGATWVPRGKEDILRTFNGL